MERSPIVRLTGVYNADAGLVGEARYFFDKMTGRAACALCDITHTRIRGKAEWQQCQTSLPVPFSTYHRNDQPADVAAFTAGQLPCIVGHHEDGGLSLAVTAAQLAECDHDVASLEALLRSLL